MHLSLISFRIRKHGCFNRSFGNAPGILLFLLLVIATVSCRRQTVRLEDTTARNEVAILGNLSFTFSEALVNDSMLNRWDSTAYITFEPAIAGRFRWEAPDKLIFSPSGPLLPATTYRAFLQKSLVSKNAGKKSLSQTRGIEFHTPYLKMEDAHAFWTIPEGGAAATPRIDLSFNYPVNPEQLRSKLVIKSDGQVTEPEFITIGSGTKMSLLLRGVKPQDKDYKLDISLKKGTLPEKGSNGTLQDDVMDFEVPSPFVLSIDGVTAEHDGTQGVIRVKTSQKPATAEFSKFISIEPSVSFTTAITEDGLMIISDQFSAENSYTINFSRGLRGVIGGVLKDPRSEQVAFGNLEPSIAFSASNATYLGKNGARNIELRISGVSRIKVVVSKIYENNLLMVQQRGYYPEDSGDDEYYYERGESGISLGDIIYETEVETKSLAKSAGGRLYQLNIADRLPDLPGIYHVKIRSTKDYWVSDSRLIALSDIGLIARRGNESVMVFANSIQTAQPMNGVQVQVYGGNNQLLGKAVTNADGMAELPVSRQEFSGFRPAMVVAKLQQDFNYLPLRSTMVNTSRFDVGGKRMNNTGLDAYIYAERDLYRPGETINAALVVRNRQWKSPGNLPVKMKWLLPNGRELQQVRKTLNNEGAAEASLTLPATAVTGTYLLEVYNANDVLLASQNLRVETFMPDRLKVQATLDKKSATPGQDLNLAIHAANYFGPPAADRKYECEIQVKRLRFAPRSFQNYEFNLQADQSVFDKAFMEGRTDAEGKAAVVFDVDTLYANTGLLQATFYTTVFDETGRPVSRVSNADIYSQPVFFGIGNRDNYYVPLRQPVRFPVIALNHQELPVNASARVQFVRYEYRTVLARSGSFFRYDSQLETKVVSTSNVIIRGANTYVPFTPSVPGKYEIRVSAPGTNSYVSHTFYSYGPWGNADAGFEVNREGKVDIELDKKSYATGGELKALFKTPFNGRMLVTVETDRVLLHRYIQVENRNASLTLPVDASWLPNAYITATLFKPHGSEAIPLTVAHGFHNISVEDNNKKMEVAITAAKTSRSRTRQKVSVKAAPNAMVTLAAVDNGILAVTDFQSPDPYRYFFARRALEVTSHDLYPLLFPELRRTLSSSGGDAETELSQRQNPMPDKRVKLVSYWSGIRQAGSNGMAEFEIDIPAFSGELRLMAVAVKDSRFGAAASTLTVADPVVISTALPRFLSPSDSVEMPVTISNTTNKQATMTARVKVTGGLQVAGSNPVSLSIDAHKEGLAVFKVAASPTIGTGKVTVVVDALGESFMEETELTIRPPSTLQKASGSAIIAPNSAQKLSLQTGQFLPSSVQYSLTLSRSPLLQLGSQLQYLLQYPFGCTEQVVSVAFPQLYAEDLMTMASGGTSGAARTTAQQIAVAMEKIKMRQLYNGSVSLWDGEGATENWWTTAYAAHFLLEAGKAGYEPDKNLMETMLSYLSIKLRNRELVPYYYNGNLQRKIAPKEVAYSLYVLALAGRPNVPAMNYYKANVKDLALDSRYLLAAAFALSGDRRNYQSVLPASFSGEISVPSTGGSFYSEIRDEGVALTALIDADPLSNQIPVMAAHVSEQLRRRPWYSTQECAFGFTALGKIARKAVKNEATATVSANGKQVGQMTGAPLKLTASALGSAQVQVNASGKGSVYAWWESSGISTDGAYQEKDSYLKVRKTFFDRFGRPVQGNSFRQNDLIVVKLTVEKAFSGVIENVVVTDLLPAGFELENPRIRELPGTEWITDATMPVQMDIRDDRIHFFTDLSGKQQFYYVVRVVNTGTFTMGPASADAMYNGSYYSYSGGRKIKVIK